MFPSFKWSRGNAFCFILVASREQVLKVSEKSEDPDQTAHSRSLIRVLTFSGCFIIGCALSGQETF